MAATGIQVVMGGAGFFYSKPAPDVPELLSLLQKHKVATIDSAVIYGDSEEVIGLNNAGDKFTIDTKLPGGIQPGTASKDNVVKMGSECLQRLKVKQVDILYMHSPDTEIPVKDTLEGLNQLHKAGAFRRLGLSNYKPEQVQEVLDVCEKNGYVKPEVYQGNYNAFARSYEGNLLPLLRKHGISFYAYSPQAGGFLSKSAEVVNSSSGEGRMHSEGMLGDMYRLLYKKPALLEGLTKWNQIATDAGLKPGDMAARWVRYNSALKKEKGDAIIIGGRTLQQVDDTLNTLEEGPLKEDIVKRIDEVWETVKNDAPVDNYHEFLAAQG